MTEKLFLERVSELGEAHRALKSMTAPYYMRMDRIKAKRDALRDDLTQLQRDLEEADNYAELSAEVERLTKVLTQFLERPDCEIKNGQLDRVSWARRKQPDAVEFQDDEDDESVLLKVSDYNEARKLFPLRPRKLDKNAAKKFDAARLESIGLHLRTGLYKAKVEHK